ncbi:MAG: ADP-ribosylglycohydrolase family protein [Clostridia bacterium]|nr:ADP-ribosylglycohydrolase family protein [Clostridia bacterium]
MAGWTDLKWLLSEELTQRKEEGCDITGFAELIEAAGDDTAKQNEVYDKLMALKVEDSFPFKEPDGYDEITSLATKDYTAKEIDYDSDSAKDKFDGAWFGRCCGCALGKPFERWPYVCGTQDGRSGASYVKQWYEGIGEWPIKGYAPAHSKAEEKVKDMSVHCPNSQRDYIKFMETDDDIRYLVLGLILTEQRGADFDAWDLGKHWHTRLTYSEVCTAETQAYLNFAQVTSHTAGERPADPAELAEKIRYTREYRNPYREWIGAQIRVDSYGFAAAGDPALAAKMAYNDASFSHVKNGIYGAMYCAAVIAAAFVEKDPMACIEAGLAQIPTTSRLYSDMKRAIAITEKAATMEEMQEAMWAEFRHYNWVHTINNAAACTGAFLWSEGDFEKAITAAVSFGWDTDCNGATVGSMAGALVGIKGIPELWKAPLNDTLYSNIPNFHPIAISECASRAREVARKIKNS